MFREEELNKKVLQYEDVLVTNREIETLRGPHFLNDVIIEFYFLHISKSLLESHASFRDDILLVLPAVSFFLQQDFGDYSHIKEFADNNQVASKQLVMFPVNNNPDAGANDGGSHWSLLVYYRKSNTFVHYDSLGTNGFCARKLFLALKKHVAAPTAETQPESIASNNAPTIVEGDNVEANPINVVDIDCNNASTSGNGDVTDSSMTSTVDNVHLDATTTTSQLPQVVKEYEDSTMKDGDSTDRVFGDSSGVENNQIQSWPFQNWMRGFSPRFMQEDEDDEEEEERENMHFRMHGHRHPYSRRYRPDYMNGHGPHHRRSLYSRWGMMRNEHRRPIHVEEDGGFREEGCMPKQRNFYDCGLYVMEIARVVCEWYYLEEEAKQQQPEHKGLFCKLKGGGLFPNIDEYVDTSLECTMRRMLLETIQRRAFENGVIIDVLSSHDHEVNDERSIVLFDEDGKSEKNELMDDDDDVAAALSLSLKSRSHKGQNMEEIFGAPPLWDSKDEKEDYDNVQDDDECILLAKKLVGFNLS